MIQQTINKAKPDTGYCNVVINLQSELPFEIIVS